MRNWDQLVDNYVRFCEARGLAPSSIAGRRRELERWGVWLKRCKPKPQIEAIDAALILDYIKSRTAFHSKSSVCGVMTNMRCMGEYLVNEGVWRQNPLRWMQGPKLDPRRRLPNRIDKEHLRKLLEAAGNLPNEYHRAWLLTALIVLYGTGLRRGELERLNVSDWNPQAGTLRIDSNKVSLQRLVPVPQAIIPYLDTYIPQRNNILLKLGIHDQEALFVTRSGKRIMGDRLGIAVHSLAKRSGIPLVTIHQFRHTCASDLLEEGLKINEVQRVLGHACISTTVRYTHIADPARRSAAALHPINNILTSLNNAGGNHD